MFQLHTLHKMCKNTVHGIWPGSWNTLLERTGICNMLFYILICYSSAWCRVYSFQLSKSSLITFTTLLKPPCRIEQKTKKEGGKDHLITQCLLAGSARVYVRPRASEWNYMEGSADVSFGHSWVTGNCVEKSILWQTLGPVPSILWGGEGFYPWRFYCHTCWNKRDSMV